MHLLITSNNLFTTFQKVQACSKVSDDHIPSPKLKSDSALTIGREKEGGQHDSHKIWTDMSKVN